MSEDVKSEELADHHWMFIEGLMKALTPDGADEEIALMKYLYLNAVTHGFKHGEGASRL